MTEHRTDYSVSRRDFIRTGTLAALSGAWAGAGVRRAAAAGRTGHAQAQDALELPGLPYAYDALEPFIDARTMEIHHDRHHAAYARNLRAALREYPQYSTQPLKTVLADIPSLPAEIQTSVRNNGGGHWNHSLFWEVMTPDGGGVPEGEVAQAIDMEWGDFESFQEVFANAGATQFGSGWAWLLVDEAGGLAVSSTPNQDNPLMHGVAEPVGTPILGLDVWEHAYYLHYQNRRADYIANWWHLVNWPRVDELYRVALTGE